MDTKLFDKRVIRRNIDRGMVSQKDYDGYLSSLENMENECEPVEVCLYPSDEEDEEKEEDEQAHETGDPGIPTAKDLS